MADNPNPAVIPEPMWDLWEACLAVIPGVRLGGIYAAKSGYHNTVEANVRNWPGNYSIRLPLDVTNPTSKARALDLTMDDAQMKLRTGYLIRSANDSRDDRLQYLREFYGTLDGRNVYGLIKDATGKTWRWSTSDSSHLWHIHLSIFTEFCDDPAIVAAVSSVLAGETWEQWSGGNPPEMEDDSMHRIRSGADDQGIYLVPGYASPRGKMAAYGLDGPRNEAYAKVPLFQLPPGLSVAASGYYDIDPQPWPTGGGGGGDDEAVPMSLTGTFTGVATPKLDN
jgi:hypothetical protein